MDGCTYSSIGNIMIVLYDPQHFRAFGYLQEYVFSIFANTLKQDKAMLISSTETSYGNAGAGGRILHYN